MIAYHQIYNIMEIISIDQQLNDFYNHLSYNDRVIFSAKFGDGKTFFLKKFSEKFNDEFMFITIHPVNYQVEGNKDIFELIKRDILFQLCENSMISDEIDVDTIVKETFDKENIADLVSFLVNLVGVAVPGASLINNLVVKFLNAKGRYDANKQTIDRLFTRFSNTSGIYENDCYTQLITKTINNFKCKNKSKKVILTIEDLDRMDPAHVFRILNIFSAHIDRGVDRVVDNLCLNKFCFDKIVTVCHYRNIEKIFHYVYGPETDFSGYINKFISHEPFMYSFCLARTEYFYKKASEICGFDFNKIKDATIDSSRTFDDEIRSLSTRKFYEIINNIERQIVDQNQKVVYGKSIYVINDFTKFLIILYRLKVNEDKIISYLIDNNHKIDMVRFIGVNWLIVNPDTRSLSVISKTRPKGFDIQVKNTGNIIYSLEIKGLTPQQTYRIDNGQLRINVHKIIDVLKGYIKI